VAGGFGAYGRVLADPRSRAFTFAGLVARLPMSMTGLSIVLLVSLDSGSFGRAGLITAAGTVSGAVIAPLWGKLIDRIGQARVLVIAALICNISLLLLVAAVLGRAPLVTTLAAAVGAGLGFSSAGSCVRARWSYRFANDPLLNTAYAWEAVLDEVVFIVGPILATFLATRIHPALGLVSCAVLGLVGAFALASLRDSQPPTRTIEQAQNSGASLSPWVLIPIVLACAALGALFGGMEVVVVAFAKEAGVLSSAGYIVMAWASGSLIAGLLTGTVQWKASPALRFRVGSALLACSVLPLPFVSRPLLLAGLLVISGLAIAPTLIASVAVTEAAVPQDKLTEALGWTSMGLAAGVAAGAAGLGQIIDQFDARAGFWGAVAVGILLIASALAVRTPRPSNDVPSDPQVSAEAGGI
jgi:MFS family permease